MRRSVLFVVIFYITNICLFGQNEIQPIENTGTRLSIHDSLSYASDSELLSANKSKRIMKLGLDGMRPTYLIDYIQFDSLPNFIRNKQLFSKGLNVKFDKDKPKVLILTSKLIKIDDTILISNEEKKNNLSRVRESDIDDIQILDKNETKKLLNIKSKHGAMIIKTKK